MKQFLRNLALVALLCVPWVTQGQALFSEDFEGGSMPTGWTSEGDGSWTVGTGVNGSYPSTAGQGTSNARINVGAYSGVTMLISPEIDLSAVTSAELSFMHVQVAWGSDIDELRVYYRSSASDEWTLIDGQEYTSAFSSWTTEDGIVLPNLSSTYQIAFEHTTNWGRGLGIDNVVITQGASCVKPSGLTATLTPGNGTIATLSWTAGATETAWVLEYGTAADFTGATSVDVSGTPSKSLTGLTAEATYYARVKADCGGSDVSDWCNVVTFTPTNAYIITVNDGTSTNSYIPVYGYYADATQRSEFIIPAASLASISGSTIGSLKFYANYSFTSTGTFKVYLKEVEESTFSGSSFYTEESATTVYTGTITITSADGMTITFNDGFDYNGGNLLVGFYQATGGNCSSSGANFYGISATGASISMYSSNSASQRNFLPKVTFSYLPSAYPKPKNLAVSGLVYNGATITWVAPSEDVVNYSYSYQANGGSWTDDATTTDLSVALSGLTGNTTYTFRVKAIYSDGESDYATKSFQTPCTPYQIPYTYGFETEGDMNCWTLLNGVTYTGVYSNSDMNTALGTSDVQYARTGDRLFFFYYAAYTNDELPYQTLVSPELTGIENGLHVEFFYKKDENGSETFRVGYSTTDNELASFSWGDEITNATTDYQRFSANYPAGTKYVALQHTSDDQYYLFIDDFTFEESASCLEPTGVAAASITTTGASISWVAGGEESAWDIYVTNNNEDVPGETTTPTVAGVTANPYSLTGLTHSTTYYVYVRAACSSTEKSAWSSPVTFHTECEGMALPFACDFESGLTVCWNTIVTNTSYTGIGVNTNSAYAHNGNNSLYFYRGSSSGDLIVVLPEVDENYPLNGYEMNFWNKGTNPVVIGIMTDPTDASTFVAISDAIASTSTYTEHLVRFNTYEGTGRYIAIKNTHSGNGYTYIDDIDVRLLPACMEPSDPTVDNTGITAHTATLNWTGTSAGYNIDYRTKAGINPVFTEDFENGIGAWSLVNCHNSTGINSTATHSGSNGFRFYYRSNPPQYLISSELTGVTEGTKLEFYYKNYSSSYPETFQVGTSTTAATTASDIETNFTFGDEITVSDQQWHLYSAIIPAGTKYICIKYTSDDQFYLYIDDIVIGNEVPAGDWQRATATTNTVTLEGLAAETTYEAKVQGDCGTDGTSEWSGMVSFTTGIACPAPTTLTAGTPDPDQVQLSWTAGGSETAWDVAYKTGDADFTIIEAVSDNPYTLTGLTPATGYTVKVRANCGGVDGVSAWTSTINFTTALACPAPIITNDSVTPYAHQAVVNWPVFTENTNGYDVNYRTAAYFNGVNEQFASSSAPTGWTRYSGLLSDVMSGTALTSTTSGWSFGTGNGVFDNHAKINIYGTSCKYWLVTPAINVAAGFVLNFDLALTAYTGSSVPAPALTGTDDKFVVLISTDDMATWTILRQWDNAESEYVYNEIANSATGEAVSISLDSYVGQSVKIAFYGESTTSNADNNLHLDNVICGLAVPAGAWQTEHVAAGTGTATITGLTPETPYDVNVTGMCAAGAESESDTVTFTTTIPCPAPTTLAATDITTNSVVLSWNETGLATAWKVAYKTVDAEEYTEVDVTTNPYTLTGLSAGTAYTVKVKADCGTEDGTSGWSNTVTFTTVCLPITEFPYTENFDEITVASVYTPTVRELPTCWSAINTCTSSSYKFFPTVSSYSNPANSTPNCLKFSSYYASWTDYDPQDQYAILPEMNGLAGMQITLQAKGSNATSTFKVGLMTDPADASTFTVIGDELALTTSYQEFVIDIPTTATAHYVAIMIDAANSTRTTNGVYVDDIRIAEPPTCLKVTDVELVSVTTTSATLSWTNGSTDQDAWQIAYSTDASFDPTAVGVTPVDVTANPGTITGLTPATTYYAYVRANCGSDGFSDWNNTALQFSTACEAFTEFPWSENFEDYAAGNFSDPCWVNERIIDGTGSGTLNVFKVVTTTVGDNTTNKLQLPDMPNGTVTKLRLPEMTFTTDQYQFILDVYRNNSQSSKTNEGVRVYISTDGEIEGATELAFIPRVYTVSNDVIPAETATGWYTYKLPFSVTGNYYIVLAGESKYGAATYMDNFVVRVTPKYDVTTSVSMTAEATPAPMGSIASTPATLTNVYDNTTIILNATPETGYHFVNWTEGDAVVSATNPYQFKLEANRDIVANFDTNTYVLAVDVAAECAGMGTVAGSNTAAEHFQNYQISATPATGYHFVQWQDGNNDNPRTVTLTEDASFTATFDTNVYNVTANVNNMAMGSVSGPATVKHFKNADYVATANTGYHFVNWTNLAGMEIGAEAVLNIAPVSDTTVYANFAVNTYALTVNVAAECTGMGTASGSNPAAEHFQNYQISATPATGYHFVQWQDGNNDNPRTVTLTAAATYTATFDTNVYNVTVNVNNTAMGSVSGPATVKHFKNADYEATANTGYHFVNWTNLAGTELGAEDVLNIAPVSDTTVIANFAVNTYALTVNVAAECTGMGTVAGSNPAAEHFQNYQISATPATGYHFAGWADLAPTDPNYTANPRTVTLTAAATFTASFDTNVYVLTVVSGNETMGSASGSVAVAKHFVNYEISAEANYGYHFTGWNDNNTDNPRTVTLTESKTYTANFTYNSYTVSGTPNNSEWGSVSGSATVNYQSDVTLTATPNYGYVFVNWKEADTVYSTQNPVAVEALSNRSLTAVFAKDQFTVNASVAAGCETMGTVAPATTTAEYMTPVTLTATPAEGYHLVSWSNGATTEQITVLADSNRNLTATFAINLYDITVNYDATRGTVTDAQSSTVASGTVFIGVAHGTVLNFTANVNEGSRFAGWNDGAATVTTESIAYTATATRTLTANFIDAGNFQVTLNHNNVMGTVTGAGAHHADSDVTITAEANYGYHFVAWMHDETIVSNNASYTFTMPMHDTSFTAVFDVNQYTLTVASVDTNRGTVSGTATVNYLANVPVSATNKYGYHFTHWYGNGINDTVATTANATIQVLRDSAVTANFDYNQYTVTAVSAAVNTGSVSGTATVNYLSNVTLTATPAAGYHFVNWTNAAGAEVSTNAVYEVQATENVTYTANFATTPAQLAWSAEAFTGYTLIDFNNWTPTLQNPNNVEVRYGVVEDDILVNAETGVIGAPTTYGNVVTTTGTYHIYAVHETSQQYYYDSVVYTLTVENGTLIALMKNIDDGGTVSFPDYTQEAALTYRYVDENMMAFIAHGTTVRAEATPATGFNFVEWRSGNNVAGYDSLSTNNPVTYTVPDEQASGLKAIFDTIVYNVTVVANPVEGSVEGPATVKHFLSGTYTATATPCYHFVNWTNADNTVVLGTEPTLTIAAVSDSTIKANFALNVYTGDTTVNVCDEFTWHDSTYTVTPEVAPTYVYKTANNCDSTVTLHLTIRHSNTGDTTAVACNSFTWYGTTYNTTPAVAPTHVFTNVAGCDSTVTLHLTVNYSNTGDTTAVACNSFTWYGTTYTSTPAVAPTHVFTNVAGCDSTVTLHLTVNHSNTGDTIAVACNSFTWYGTTYTSTPAVAPTHVLTNVAGCDSTVTLHLTVNHSNTGDTTAVACDSLTWYGVTYTSTPAVAPTHVLTNVAGCDSTVTLHLTINNSQTVTIDPITNCDSVLWNNTWYYQSGEQSFTTTGANGCDSTTIVMLTINNSQTVVLDPVVAYDSYEWNGVVYTESGELSFTTDGANGCDSTTTVMLTINHYDSITVILTVNDATMGTTDPEAGTYRFYPGETVSATATANEGYRFLGWVVSYGSYSDTVSRDAEVSYEFVAAMAGQTFTVEAVFAENVGIKTVDYSNINIFSADSKVYVKGAEGMTIYIYDVNGRCMARRANAAETETFTLDVTGVVLVKAGNAPAKRVLLVR